MSSATPESPIKLDAKLASPLDQIRGTIRQYVLSDVAVTVAIVVVLWFWLGLVLDYGLFKLTGFDWVLDSSLPIRYIAQLALVLGLVGVLVVRRESVKRLVSLVPQPWIRRHLLELPALFHVLIAALLAPVFLVILLVRYIFWLRTSDEDREMALVLEKRFPDVLGDRLITAVELADIEKQKAYGFSTDMIRKTIDEARERVAQVPVASVFNWDRIRNKVIVLGVVAIGTLALSYAAYAAFGNRSAQKFPGEFGDVATIWAERNILFRNTPWPRQAHIELIGFPGDELRIGKDAAAPKITTRAFKWVLADRSQPHGWRPLLWTDLSELSGVAPLAQGVFEAPKPLPEAARGWDLDRIETERADNPGVDVLMKKLEGLAADSRYSRTLRKLAIPDAISLTFNGEKMRGKVNLNREPGNQFTGEISGLKESVRFVVRGADFSTIPRAITLVPPPAFQKLERYEYQPAYLYHAPPVVDGEQKLTALKGLRQSIGAKSLSLTGDKSLFTIVQGTEFILSGQADKPLKHVLATPKIGQLPGQTAGSTEPLIVPTSNPERTEFTLAFRGADRPTSNLEFDLTLVDDDDVTSSRTLLVQVADDAIPMIEVAVDALRKQGNSYLVTPVARVPFLTESKIKDDAGISKAVFDYTYQQVDAAVTVEAKIPVLAGVFAGAPAMPSIGSSIRSAIAAQLMQDSSDMNRGQPVSGEFPLSRFVEDFAKKRADTLEGLKRKLEVPQPPDDPQVIKELRLRDQDTDVFDLRSAIPSLEEKDRSKAQPRYRIDVVVKVTDTNIETGPKVGQSLETIRLLVISEAELLVEMAKDEEVQIARLDEVLKKLRMAQVKLVQTAQRLRDLAPPPDLLVSASVRSQDLAQDVAKARELTLAIQTEYKRLEKEARFNDIKQTQQRIENEILRDLDFIIERGYVTAEDTHRAFQTALIEGRRPEEALIAKDQADLQSLITQVQTLREKLGEAVSLTKFRAELEKIKNRLEENDKIFALILRTSLERLRMPVIATIPTIELNKGEKKLIKNPLNWLAFDGNEYKVAIKGPAGDVLKFPMEILVADDKNDVEYELTAGNQAGEYTLQLVPSVGNPIEVKVKVK